MQDYEKPARFSASERNNRANFARNLEKSARNRKFFAPYGFTIIEVALVLAIAGLIFLVVFLALPALQRSQRDSARRQDVAKAIAAIDQYFADGGDFGFVGTTNYLHVPLAQTSDEFPLGSYLKNAGFSPNVEKVNLLSPTYGSHVGSTHPGMNQLDIFVGRTCNAPSGSTSDWGVGVTAAPSLNVAAVGISLESGVSICQTATR